MNTTIPQDVKTLSLELASKTGLDARTFAAWFFAEDSGNRTALVANNNPLNIAFRGAGHPWESNYEWFKGTTGIQANGIVVYESIDAFATAAAALILAYYHTITATAGQSPDVQAKAIQDSPWDAGHYGEGSSANPDGLIVEIVRELMAAYPNGLADPAPATPTTEPTTSTQASTGTPNPNYTSLDDIGAAAVGVAQEFGDLYMHDENGRDVYHSMLTVFRAYLIGRGFAKSQSNPAGYENAVISTALKDYVI